MSLDVALAEKVAFVTGAGSGIGEEIAKAFAAAGAFVIVNDMREDGRRVADEVGGSFVQADISNIDATRRMCEQALEVRGRVDVLVNNAGFQNMSRVDDFPDEMWAKMVQVMLVAAFQTTKYLLPGMKERGWGRIINISSIHGLVASPFKSAYVAAKHGLVGLTKTVALEAGEHGVTVNAICPGFTRTPLVEAQIADQARLNNMTDEEVVESIILAPAAIKRLIEPDEIAALARFLASDDARSITGGAYAIDVGWAAR